MLDLTPEEKQLILECLSNVNTNGANWEQRLKPLFIKIQSSMVAEPASELPTSGEIVSEVKEGDAVSPEE